MIIEILMESTIEKGGHGVWCAILNVYINKIGEAKTEHLQEEKSLVILEMISSLNTVPCMALGERLFSLKHLSSVFALTHKPVNWVQQSTPHALW